MSRKIYVTLKCKLVLLISDPSVDLEEVMSDMDYDITSNNPGADVEETEITDWSINTEHGKAYVDLDVSLVIRADAGVGISDILADLDYDFDSDTSGANVEEMEMIDQTVVDSK